MNNELRDKVIEILVDVYDRQAQVCEAADEIIDLVEHSLPQQKGTEPVAWTLRWPLDIKRGTVNYMTTFGTKERAREYADKCTDGESIVVAPLILHQPKPAAQPVRCEYCGGSGDVHSIDGEWRGSCTECQPAAQPETEASLVADALEAANWSGVPIGNKCFILSAIEHLRAAQPADIDADELSNFIRKIDGNHSMGAGALAENIVEWIGKQAAQTCWQPIDTAPKDNSRPLYLAAFRGGELVELDFNGGWESESESWEMPQVYYYWASENGIEEPTHWAYQDEPLPALPADAAQPKVLDAINVHPILQKEVDEFIASESCYDPEHPKSSEHDYILVDDLRQWMAGYMRVPVEFVDDAMCRTCYTHAAYMTNPCQWCRDREAMLDATTEEP